MFIYFERERERQRERKRERTSESQCVNRGGAEKEGEIESQAGSMLSVQNQCRAVSREPQDHDLSRNKESDI